MIKKIEIKLSPSDSAAVLKARAAAKSGIPEQQIKYFEILKRSVDARDKGNVQYVYSVGLGDETPVIPTLPEKKFRKPARRPLIVGAGPAGLFAALDLAKKGFCPIVAERGGNVDARKAAVEHFYATGELDLSCNVQYGEGGAGAFSDGKLNTGIKSVYKRYILEQFVRHGAPDEILYDGKPHIGSDRLPEVVKNIRNEIIALGGEFMFGRTLTDLKISGGRVTEVVFDGGAAAVEPEFVILAIGHSARDTYRSLYARGLAMEAKDVAVGFRIEHLRKDIDRAQYGKFASVMGAADYKLTSGASERGVFSFCMCPGGQVVAAASEEGGVVTNGMSDYARAAVNSNSAVVAQVRKEDYPSGVLGGIDYLRKIERAAYEAGGGAYRAPVQLLGDFMRGKDSTSFGKIKPTYPRGTAFGRIDLLLPDYLTKALRLGIADMDRRLRGFACADAVLTAPETRTSSPVRIVRLDSLASPTAENLYPCGEIGYAGGIMSAAADGLKVSAQASVKYEEC